VSSVSTRGIVAAGLIVAAPLSIALATLFGSVVIDAGNWLAALVGRADATTSEIIWRLRVPRAGAAFVTGAMLALAGVLLQNLLRNPLADPYVLGLSGGASVGAMLGMLAGFGPWSLHLSALGGAVVVACVLVAFAARATGWEIHRVLLVGVGLASVSGALVSLLLTLAPAPRLPGLLYWLMGDLSGAALHWSTVPALFAAVLIATAIAADLDALALGPDQARLLGVAVGRTQTIAFAIAAIATVSAVLIGGAIGFVGLAVPHLLRLLGVHAHRWLVPLAALAGGTLVTLADTAARSAAAPIEIPVGIATALLGVPVLLWLVVRAR
jgi:iron complex transport system permease protein